MKHNHISIQSSITLFMYTIHVGPNSLVQFCRSLIGARKHEFFCDSLTPHCGKHWEYTDIRKIVLLSENEERVFETKLSEIFIRRSIGMQECPECGSFSERRDKKATCVVCPICTNKKEKTYEFCWYCLKTWSSSNYQKCLNADCVGFDQRLKILKGPFTKEISGVRNCPAVRACPKCGILIEHQDRTKHMHCVCCQPFCFICLKLVINRKYQCGSWNTPYNVAPVQEEIQGD